MTRDPLAAFDDETFETVASRCDPTTERLRDLARRHQETIRSLPGVEDLVYEWRRSFAGDPVVERTESAYYLSLPDHVWAEFVAVLDLEEGGVDALRAVHRAQLRRVTGTEADEPMVLTRP